MADTHCTIRFIRRTSDLPGKEVSDQVKGTAKTAYRLTANEGGPGQLRMLMVELLAGYPLCRCGGAPPESEASVESRSSGTKAAENRQNHVSLGMKRQPAIVRRASHGLRPWSAVLSGLAAFFACGCATRNSPSTKSSTPPFVGAIQAIKHSIIPIVCGQAVPDRETKELKMQVIFVEGTGFFVAADGTFVTADHVIEATLDPTRQIPCPRVGFTLPASGAWDTELAPTAQPEFYEFDAGACKRDKSLDVARCRSKRAIDRVHNIAPVTFEEAMQSDGTPIAFTGFQHQIPLSSIGNIAGYATLPNGAQEIIMDKTGWSGASGSPFYLANGRVVGMLQLSGTGQGPGRAMGRPSRFIEDFLRDPGSASPAHL